MINNTHLYPELHLFVIFCSTQARLGDKGSIESPSLSAEHIRNAHCLSLGKFITLTNILTPPISIIESQTVSM